MIIFGKLSRFKAVTSSKNCALNYLKQRCNGLDGYMFEDG